MSERSAGRLEAVTRLSAARTRLLAGLVLVAVFWAVSWLQLRPASDHAFFPLWLGYILTVDGLVELRTGTSPIARSGWRVVWLFAVSVPLWWFFEGFNRVLDNWHYLTPRSYSDVEYFLLASLSFSTVVPAVLTTTELVRSLRRDPLRRLPPIAPRPWLLIAFHLTGWLMVGLAVRWPNYAFPLVWLSLIFLLDPIATVLGGRSLAWYVARGDWSPLFNLGLATLVCGWFWEMWNFFSMPKWTYSIPHVGFLPVFEMPILGYSGYIPFGMEVYVVYVVALRIRPGVRMPQPRVSSRGV